MLHRFRAPQSSAGCIVQDPRLYTMIREQQKAFSVCKQRKTEEWIQTSFRLEWDACLKMLHAKWSRDLRYAGTFKAPHCTAPHRTVPYWTAPHRTACTPE